MAFMGFMKRICLLMVLLSYYYDSTSCQECPFGAQPEVSYPSDYFMMNVKEMGARGDGKTDDWNAIQKAINEEVKHVSATML